MLDSTDAAQQFGQSPRRRTSGPAAGPSPDRYYSARLWQLARLDLDEQSAEALWHAATRHRRGLEAQLGRDVGQRVALLDYVLNVRRQLVEPQIIERTVLEEIEHRAMVDALTGLFNRHYFDRELVREVERCRRYGARSALLLLDLDGFKEVNDTDGHPTGDRVLDIVGTRILKHVRAPDIPCRYGGDEFALILPDTSGAEARVVAERVRADIARWFSERGVAGRFVHVTVSGGVAATEGEPTLASADWLLTEADRALYVAKHAGGNQIVGPRGAESLLVRTATAPIGGR